ncbi:hypothetical protein BDD12DRAFT_850160 [Trichophaea hybrida]|nr:hypothetical protein BDD12DRAFT_850160 [Trichophaea hybrida]
MLCTHVSILVANNAIYLLLCCILLSTWNLLAAVAPNGPSCVSWCSRREKKEQCAALLPMPKSTARSSQDKRK